MYRKGAVVSLFLSLFLLVSSGSHARKLKEKVLKKVETKQFLITVPPVKWEPPVFMAIPDLSKLVSGKLVSIKIAPYKESSRVSIAVSGRLRFRGIAGDTNLSAESDDEREQWLLLKREIKNGKPVIRISRVTKNVVSGLVVSEEIATYRKLDEVKKNIQLLIATRRGASDPRIVMEFRKK